MKHHQHAYLVSDPPREHPIVEILLAALGCALAGFLMFGGLALVAIWLGF